MWHVFCSGVTVLLTPGQSGSVDVVRSIVYVVDAPSVAGVALGAPRTDAESTHVLCRHEDEATPDFVHRVLRRIARIQRDRHIGSLCYVVGPEAARDGSAPPLHSLMQGLRSGTSLTVVGPGSSAGCGLLVDRVDPAASARWRDGESSAVCGWCRATSLPRPQRRPHRSSPRNVRWRHARALGSTDFRSKERSCRSTAQALTQAERNESYRPGDKGARSSSTTTSPPTTSDRSSAP